MDDTVGIDRAGATAEAVAEAVQSSGTVDSAISTLENSLAAYLNGGGSVDEVVPGGDPDGLGFGRRAGTGRSLWDRYVDVLRDDVCGSGGELHKLLSQGLAASGATLVTTIIYVLGIPMGAAPVIAPIAGVMLALGLKAFCPADQGETQA